MGYVEEFNTSNFVGIVNNNNDDASGTTKKYVTPDTPSVLPSITNDSLMRIAEDEGYTVERRKVNIDELNDFDEVFAVGTAVVATPIGSVTILGAGRGGDEDDDGSDNNDDDIVYKFGDRGGD